MKFRGIETLSPQAVQAYLSKLKSIQTTAGDLLTAYLPQGTRLSGVISEKVLERVEEENRILLDRLEPETGLVLFYDFHRMVCEAIAPPFLSLSQPGSLGTVLRSLCLKRS
ncbi:hypothetical protein [Methanosarcina barkeri]|uniref:hypothetical protein n=1 Tax=Methanosarcina barkeri TaxID=2208 RepID=UPI000ABB2381|nr:hypothetical protein [Methanosarcina barkeri]